MITAGEHISRPRPGELADQAAEAIRALNHVTPEALDYPGDLYEVIASLKLMAQRLPQLFGQMSAWLEHEHAAGRIAHDTRQIPEQYVRGVTGSLARAGADSSALADALNAAHNGCSGLKAAQPEAGDRPAGTGAGSCSRQLQPAGRQAEMSTPPASDPTLAPTGIGAQRRIRALIARAWSPEAIERAAGLPAADARRALADRRRVEPRTSGRRRPRL